MKDDLFSKAYEAFIDATYSGNGEPAALRAAIRAVVEECMNACANAELFDGDRLKNSDPRQTCSDAIRKIMQEDK